jgi:hypothetical protein
LAVAAIRTPNRKPDSYDRVSRDKKNRGRDFFVASYSLQWVGRLAVNLP